MKNISEKLRIAIIADPLDNQFAGIHVYTRNMIKALALHHNKIELFVLRNEAAKVQKLKNYTELVISKSVPLRFDPHRNFVRLVKVCTQLNVQIVVEPAHIGPLNFPKSILPVTVIHDLTPILFPQWHPTLSATIQKKLLPIILKKTGLVLTNSNNTLNDVINIYPFCASKTRMVYPAIDRKFFLQPKNVNISKKQNFILFVGTIEPRKNIELLIQAFEIFVEKTQFTGSLKLIGRAGWKMKNFKSIILNSSVSKQINWLQYVSKVDLMEHYASALFSVYPSQYEGFGFPVAESMASGTPVIAAQNSSITEVGAHAALFFETNNLESLVNNMIMLYNSPKLQAQMIESGLKLAENFTIQKFGKNLLHELEEAYNNWTTS